MLVNPFLIQMLQGFVSPKTVQLMTLKILKRALRRIILICD